MNIQSMTFAEMCGDGLFKDGDWIESKDQDPNGDVRIIQLADIGVGQFIDKSSRFMTLEKTRELNCTYLQEGDILIARMPDPIGRACILPAIPQVCVTAVDVCIVRLDSEEIDSRWLMHKINSSSFNHQILQFVTGTTRKRISRGNLSKLMIDIPPVDEQKRIADILDKADEIKHESAKARVLRKDVVQSLFYDMFGDPVANPMDWQIRVLGDICGVGSSKRVFKTELVEEGIPFYRGTEIGKLGNGETITPSLFITKQHYEALKEHSGVPKIGDLLMPSICPDGRIFTVIDDSPFYFKDGRVLWIKVEQSVINSTFLRYLLKAIFYSNYENIASGTTFAELKIFALKKMALPLPPIGLQNKFASTLELIQKIPTTEVLVETNSNSLTQHLLS